MSLAANLMGGEGGHSLAGTPHSRRTAPCPPAQAVLLAPDPQPPAPSPGSASRSQPAAPTIHSAPHS